MSTATATAGPDVLECRPDEKPMASWQARLAALMSRGVGGDDPRVRQCRAAMSYWHVAKVINAQGDRLDQAAADLLTRRLLEVSS